MQFAYLAHHFLILFFAGVSSQPAATAEAIPSHPSQTATLLLDVPETNGDERFTTHQKVNSPKPEGADANEGRRITVRAQGHTSSPYQGDAVLTNQVGVEDHGVRGVDRVSGEVMSHEAPMPIYGSSPDKVRGLRTAVTALLFIGGYLLAHVLATPGKSFSNVLEVKSLLTYENRYLASAAASAGMLLSGLGEILQHMLFDRPLRGPRSRPHTHRLKRRRGMPQMFVAAILYVMCIGAAVELGPLAPVSLVHLQTLSLVAAGLFYWGAALYFDPFGLSSS
ncbi:hypothetical protein, conserved [Eimeria tenella]|uniref:Uncharacterized protein n=1 Tax=Eimeria tenella TaxID=5802 RepID=U6KYC8_EIMTE|nr:hypothetical protein, conserved [Eimeria tenella]CDJ41918.1 hypothetical protein, conserved [Eimeria tenella]|eukprot:XP_013232668.1 hypothetical protein, conserved [Eimeria tenella]